MSGDIVQAEDASSPVENDAERWESEQLRLHLGLGESIAQPTQPPLFFVERAPYSSRGARCKLSSCSGTIRPYTYRIALNPGMSGPHWLQSSGRTTDYYHIACFEKIADLSQKTFVDRVIPVTRGTYRGRNLRAVNVFDGYLCCGGVERLVEGWRAQRLRWFDKRDGVNQEPANPAFEELLRRAGSSMYRPERTADMDSEEWFRFCTELAPIESDGPDDSEEWDLFDTYLGDENDPDFLPEGCDLSVVLDLWKMDQVRLTTPLSYFRASPSPIPSTAHRPPSHQHLATAPDDELNDLQRRAKAELGAKAVRAIKRLSAIPMPNVQRTFLS